MESQISLSFDRCVSFNGHHTPVLGPRDYATAALICPHVASLFGAPVSLFGRIAEIVDQGTPPCPASGAIYALLAFITGCACLYSCTYRSRMRKVYMLKESPCNDCLIHWCCETCALCQEYRELKNRGFDMSLGWEGNVRRQNQGAGAMAPPSVQAFGEK